MHQGIGMAGITPLLDAIWDDYMFWSIVVGAIAFGWLYHHSYFYRAKEGESPNIDDLEVGVFPKAVSYTHLTLPTICSV